MALNHRILSLVFMALFFLVASISFVRAQNEEMRVEANVFAPIVKIEIPEYEFFGNVSKGLSSDRIRIDINNTGTTDVIVTPELEDSQEKIFSYLYFARRTTDEYKRLGSFSISIPKPTSQGKKESDYFYAKLDLTTYAEDISQDLLGHRTNLRFVVLAQ